MTLMRRDSLLLWMLIMPIVEGVIIRYAVPPLTNYVADMIDLTKYYSLIIGYICIAIPPVFYGFVIGFLFLDERDDKTLSALQVTPLPMSFFLTYRPTFSLLLSTGMIVLIVLISNLLPIPPIELILAALLASLSAPLTALFIVTFAENKVQGFAVTKIIGTLCLAPIVAYFVDMPWQLILGIIPAYWPVKIYWLGLEGESIVLYFLTGLVYQAILLMYLLKRFQSILGRIG